MDEEGLCPAGKENVLTTGDGTEGAADAKGSLFCNQNTWDTYQVLVGPLGHPFVPCFTAEGPRAQGPRAWNTV